MPYLYLLRAYRQQEILCSRFFGQPADEKLAHKIEDTVKEDEHVIGVHDLIVHDYGPGRRFASLHAELPYNMDMFDAHEIIDTAEKRGKK